MCLCFWSFWIWKLNQPEGQGSLRVWVQRQTWIGIRKRWWALSTIHCKFNLLWTLGISTSKYDIDKVPIKPPLWHFKKKINQGKPNKPWSWDGWWNDHLPQCWLSVWSTTEKPSFSKFLMVISKVASGQLSNLDNKNKFLPTGANAVQKGNWFLKDHIVVMPCAPWANVLWTYFLDRHCVSSAWLQLVNAEMIPYHMFTTDTCQIARHNRMCLLFKLISLCLLLQASMESMV